RVDRGNGRAVLAPAPTPDASSLANVLPLCWQMCWVKSLLINNVLDVLPFLRVYPPELAGRRRTGPKKRQWGILRHVKSRMGGVKAFVGLRRLLKASEC